MSDIIFGFLIGWIIALVTVISIMYMESKCDQLRKKWSDKNDADNH